MKKGKNKKFFNRSTPRRFDPTPLVGDVDTSRNNVKLMLVKLPEQLAKQFEDSSNGIVGRIRFLNNTNQQSKQSSEDTKQPIKSEPKPSVNTQQTNSIQEDNPFIAETMDMSIQKITQVPEGYIFLDKVPTNNTKSSNINNNSNSTNGKSSGMKPMIPSSNSSSSSKMKTMKLGSASSSSALGATPLRKLAKPSLFESTKFIPKKYELFSQQSDKDMAIFSGNATNEENDEMRVEGVVDSQYQARPVMDEQFQKLNKYRSQSMNQTSSKMATISERQIRQAELAALRPRAVMETMKERDERKRKKEESRRHLDVKDDDWKDSTTSDIFKAFEIQAYYTAEDLANTIGEPVSRIRPLISELCQYNKAGPFAQRYELKDEFKTVAQRERKERDIEEHKQKQLEITKKRKEERDREKTDGDQPKNKKMRTT